MQIINLENRYPSPYNKRALAAIRRIIWHHSAGSIPTTPTQALAQLDSIYRYHTQTLGWPGRGYHFGIGSGQVYQLNSLDEVSYHTAYENDDSIGACFLGSYEQGQPSDADLTAGRELAAHLESVLGRELAHQGHAEANPSSTAFCPSREWNRWRGALKVIRPDEDMTYFSTFGVPANPVAAIYKYWLEQRRLGANMGPAITGELDGAPYGEVGNIVQFFANAAVVCKPAEGYACYRATQYLEPERWKLPA
jgi:hypothetical protein